MNKGTHLILFLIGLFAWLRIHLIGMIGISELACLLMGPVLFLVDYKALKRDGMLPICWLFLATCAGCLLSSFYNQTDFFRWSRGLATPLVLFAVFVTVYHFLKNDPNGIVSFILGWSFSGLVVFLIKGGDVSALMDDEGQVGTNSAAVMRMYFFSPIVLIPIRCFYSKIPAALSFLILLCWGTYVIFASASGRSTSIAIFAGALLVLAGQKSIQKMARIRKHFILAMCLGLVGVFVAKGLYSHAAASGLLGEESRKKYLLQTRSGSGMLQLLMGGRVEFFAGAYAAIEQPIIGYGPWPYDYNDTYGQFLSQYGDYDDARRYTESLAKSGGLSYIPAHSHIVGFWLWYGVPGLILWLYVLFLNFEFFKKYVDAVPQWFGMFASLLPALLWEIFFSPLGQRVQEAALLCALLLARAIGQDRRTMTAEMCRERTRFLP